MWLFGAGLSEIATTRMLKKLSIAGFVFRTPDGLSAVRRSASLEELNISECVRISVACLFDVVQMPQLKILVMHQRWFVDRCSAKQAIYDKAIHPEFIIRFDF